MALATLVLAALAGCGRQDRLSPVDPARPDEIPTEAWATLTDERAVSFWNQLPGSVGAWSTDDVLLGSRDGLVIRRTGDEYRRIDIDTDETVYGLECVSDGTAWALSYDGVVYHGDGAGWERDVNLPAEGYMGMVRADDGTLWTYGYDGRLWRRSPAGWFEYDLPDSLDLCGGWTGPDGEALFVTWSLQLVRVEGESWSIENIDPSLPRYNSWCRIDGDGEGRLLASVRNERFFWWNDGGGWVRFEAPEGSDEDIEDTFLLDGEPYAVLSPAMELGRWNGTEWVDRVPLSYPSRLANTRSIPLDGGRLLAFESGGQEFVRPGHAEPLAIAIGGLQGVTVHEGSLLLCTWQGEILEQTGDHWRLKPRILPDGERIVSGGLVHDADGALLVCTGDEVWRIKQGWDAEPVSLPFGADLCGGGDGRAYFVSGTAISEIAGGEAVTRWHLSRDLDINALSSDGDGGFWIRSGHVLYRTVETREDPVLLADGWTMGGVTLDPLRGLVVFGRDRVLLHADGVFTDVSPLDVGLVTWQPFDISSVCLDGAGNWVAASPNGGCLLRYDGEGWTRLECEFPPTVETVFDGLSVFAGGGGRLFVLSGLTLMSLDVGEAAL